MKPFTIWTRRVLSNVETRPFAHLDYDRDIHLGGQWIASSGTAHQSLNFNNAPYFIK